MRRVCTGVLLHSERSVRERGPGQGGVRGECGWVHESLPLGASVARGGWRERLPLGGIAAHCGVRAIGGHRERVNGVEGEGLREK